MFSLEKIVKVTSLHHALRDVKHLFWTIFRINMWFEEGYPRIFIADYSDGAAEIFREIKVNTLAVNDLALSFAKQYWVIIWLRGINR